MAGDLRQAGGTLVNHIAKWDGAQWAPLADGTDNDIFAVAVYQDRLFAGGFFSAASNVPGTACLALWDGTAWMATGSPLTQCYVRSFAVDGSLLIVGGVFVLPGESTGTYVAVWDGEQFRASAAANQFLPGSTAFTLLPTPDGVYAGGVFTSSADGTESNIIVNRNGTWVLCGTADVRTAYANTFAQYDF